MGKADVFVLSPAQTFRAINPKTEETHINIEKDWNPSFSLGRSVFSETDIPRWKFWRKARKLVLIGEGATQAFELVQKEGETSELLAHFGTTKEIKKFVAQCVAKSKAQQKPFSSVWLVAILIGLGIVAVEGLVILQRLGALRF